ncbi:hypothetical protein ACFP81_03615 [Deinococcus lacus]|uniref:Lipoprotein n=1 Tax=Deinococcus lacus TaxID=392561 RepID=A0ABW1YCH2_9DEIO
MNRLLLASALALVALAGCAPAPTARPPVQASTSFNSVSFYPYETGLTLTYLPEGEPQGSLPYVLRALGPTIFKGQSVHAFQMTGRGAEQTWYRTVDASGVKLLGFTKPGVTVSLEPAWLELPPQNAWKVGYAWQGQSTATVVDVSGKEKARGTLQYRYDVQDRREVKTPAGTFQVWVITRRMSDDLGGLFPDVQQSYFVPYLGDVKTYEGLLLTGRNFQSAVEPARRP